MINGTTHKTALPGAAHKKTVKQIADDCGLNSTQRFRLENAIKKKGYSHDPTIAEVVTALYRHIEKLEKWKAEDISATPPMQEIARELNIPLGTTIHDKILPLIKDMKARIASLVEIGLKIDQSLAASIENHLKTNDKLKRMKAGIRKALKTADRQACDECPDPIGDCLDMLRQLLGK